MNHTPEPWEYAPETRIIWDATGDVALAQIEKHTLSTTQERLANGQRIVACVNACQNIPSEELENGVLNELIEACRALDDRLASLPISTDDNETWDAIKKADSVLARLKPESEAWKECPLCGKNALQEKHGEFQFDPPNNVPGGTIVIGDAVWLACDECGEEILPHALSKSIDAERYRRLGFLSPPPEPESEVAK